ncbi:MAG: TSUP family transporter [Acidimicrobiia bacterium]
MTTERCLLYPALSAAQLVGTDLVQAIPLIAAAALGHLLIGDVQLTLTGALLVGGIPGAYLGARLSSRAPDHFIRPVLMVVLLISGLKLLAASDASVLVTAGIAVAVGIVVAARAMRHRSKVPTPPQ